MKKKAITSILILFTGFVFGQTNLILNPSFEIYTDCPSSLGEIIKATGWKSSWGSPDYYNECSPPGLSSQSTPLNWAGYQMPANGLGYAGLLAYNSIVPNTREFLSQKLITPLNIGVKYYVSFKANLTLNPVANYNCATNNLGATFSMSNYCCFSYVKNYAALHSNTVINDSTNWTNLFGHLVADSSYNYIVFGNFFDDSNTNVQKLFNSSFDQSYYFIDDVCLSTDSSYTYNYATSTATHKLDKKELKIFPNPTSNYLTIKLKGKNKIKLYTNQNQCVFSNEFNDSLIYDTTLLPGGVYFIYVTSGHESYYKKISVIH